jgi:hypothetical protein
MTKFFLHSINKRKCLPKVLREITYGLTLHEMDLETIKMRGHLDLMLIVFGDLVGLPLLPSYYAMRLLPYILPTIETWERSLLRERDLTDFVSSDLQAGGRTKPFVMGKGI